jgi:hypothetical protein
MEVLIEHASIWHQDRLGIAGALAKAAAHNAQEGFDDLDFSVLPGFKDLFGTNLDTLATAVAQFCGNDREPGDVFPGKALPLAVIPGNHSFSPGAIAVIFLILPD